MGLWTLTAAVAVLGVVFVALTVGTSFVKMSMVLGLLRNALGAPDAPSNVVVIALAAVLTVHVMAPTGTAVMAATQPYVSAAMSADVATEAGRAAVVQLLASARPPVLRFLRANATARDRRVFLDLSRASRRRQGVTGDAPTADDITVLAPAFVVSELTSAFAIGFLLFLPFLVVELVIANLLVALGLTSVQPSTVALPFKLLLFVLADGWYLLARALVLGYR